VELEPTVIAPGAGEVIGDSADRRVEILVDTPELATTWSRFGPGRDGAGLHIHREHSDLFYVLEGELAVKTGEDSSVTAKAGTLVMIPPMVIHGFRNASEDADVIYLNLHTPGCGFADYMRAIRDKGDTEWFDQFDPQGIDGIRPMSEIQVFVTVPAPPLR
jgi:mannose-6-phosphate isomerase-like protein (cupin superfamily)